MAAESSLRPASRGACSIRKSLALRAGVLLMPGRMELAVTPVRVARICPESVA